MSPRGRAPGAFAAWVARGRLSSLWGNMLNVKSRFRRDRMAAAALQGLMVGGGLGLSMTLIEYDPLLGGYEPLVIGVIAGLGTAFLVIVYPHD